MLKQGQLLNDTYQIVRLIGEGGMGAVYEAKHARLAGRYAVKVLLPNPSDLDNAQALARFEREARTTSLLQHPNIVQIVDFNRAADGTRYLVMEYLQGQSLADRLFREGALSQGTVVGIVQQIAAALAVAHSRGVVHRDLKPDNIYLVPVEGRQYEQVKILDFGISKVRDPSRGADGPPSAWGPVSVMMGTPQYMAPEQCQGRTSEIGSATDQFALAVITYEMLSGRVPFQGDSIGAVLSGVLHCDPPPLDVAPALTAVVHRGLAKKNRDRFPSVTAFSDALRAAVTETGDDVTVPMAAPIDLAASIDDTLKNLTGPATMADVSRLRAHAASSRRRRRTWAMGLSTAAAVSITAFLAVGNDPRLSTWLRRVALAIPFAEGATWNATWKDTHATAPAGATIAGRVRVAAPAAAPAPPVAPTPAPAPIDEAPVTALAPRSLTTAAGIEVVPLPADSSSSSSKAANRSRARRAQRAAAERDRALAARENERQPPREKAPSRATIIDRASQTPAPRVHDDDATMPLDDQRP